MNKIVKNVLIALNLLLGLFVIYDFFALLFYPTKVVPFLFNYFIYFLIGSTLLTIVIYFFGSRNEKKFDSKKILDGLMTSSPIFLVIFPVILLLLLFGVGKISHSQVAASLTGLIFPSYYISLILLPQLVLVGYILPEKIKTRVGDFFAKFRKVLTILTVVLDVIGFGFLVSLVAFPAASINAYFSTFALPIFFLALVLSLVVVFVRLRELKKINLVDYLPFLALIIVILAFVSPDLLGVASVTAFAFVFYLVPTIIVLLNFVPNKWNIRISKNK